jgi:hypothetical protein
MNMREKQKPKDTLTDQKITWISLILYGIITWFGSWRVFKVLKTFFPGLSAAIYTGVCILLCSLLPIGFLLSDHRLDRLGNYWLCLQLTTFFTALPEWVIKVILADWLKILDWNHLVYVSLALFLITWIITVLGIIHGKQIRLVTYDCSVEKKRFQGKSLRIAHLSDLHLGSINNAKEIRKVVNQVNELKPDLVCITGDTFTESIHSVPNQNQIIDALRSLNARYGVYACLGNHDAGSEFPKMVTFFESAGITLLEDECISMEGFTLLGRRDLMQGNMLTPNRKTIEAFLADIDSEDLLIAMDHQPCDIEDSAKAGVDILLSGHTHGGQFFPIHLIVRRFFPHYHGCKKYDSMYSIVSSGTCSAIPPVRIGSQSEIIQIMVHGS